MHINLKQMLRLVPTSQIHYVLYFQPGYVYGIYPAHISQFPISYYPCKSSSLTSRWEILLNHNPGDTRTVIKYYSKTRLT